MKLKYLVVLDMDGTITTTNSWRDLHEYFGTLEGAERNKELYLQGKIDYREWIERDVMLWGRPSYDEVRKVLLKYETREGFEDFCRSLRSNAVFAIVSGGIDVRAADIKATYGLHETFANSLVVDRGKVVGGSKRVEIGKKGKFVEFLRKKYNPEITVCVGDTEFDRDMLESGDVGISIANKIPRADFHARDFSEILEIVKSLDKNVRVGRRYK